MESPSPRMPGKRAFSALAGLTLAGEANRLAGMVTHSGGKVPVILTIAGFDPSSGAGITADLKTIAAHGCYGMACVTALTVQNTMGVFGVEAVAGALVRDTLKKLAEDPSFAAIEDPSFAAIKVGMLGSAEIATAVTDFLKSQPGVPVILDPIIRSSSGAELLDRLGVEVLRTKLLPLATVITPNLAEAEALTGLPVTNVGEMKAAARHLQRLGARNVVVTGGHLPENTDVLLTETGEAIEISGARVESASTHGTGCAFSTAIACRLANGDGLEKAVRAAKEYVRQAIEQAYAIGNGTGPLNHLFRLE